MIKVISDTKVPVKIWASDLEQEAEQQLRNLSSLPFIYKHVAAMPDAHSGKGSTVGTVIATQGAIIPAAVGVDIGCGMAAIKLPFSIEKLTDLAKLRHSIERAVPTGRHANKEANSSVIKTFADLGSWSELGLSKLNSRVITNAQNSIGSLGGGNHFIEICQDQNNEPWIMLHSGSRNIGKVLAEIHIDKAKNLMKEYFISLPDQDLAYLAQNTKEFKDYLKDLMWGQKFASANREEIMRRVLEQVYRHAYDNETWKQHLDLDEGVNNLFKVNCHHNYTSIENHFGKNVYITRKGAVSARDGEWGIIPSSMGGISHIVQGKGNADSFCSCSHGSGRRMSRTKAREQFTVADLELQTAGVECRKDNGILDEIPSSYKDINTVMKNQEDLVTSVYQLKALLCIKGD